MEDRAGRCPQVHAMGAPGTDDGFQTSRTDVDAPVRACRDGKSQHRPRRPTTHNAYNAQISAGSLLVPESRRIARLLLGCPTPDQWDAAIVRDNLLQKRPATARRQARLIRNRLEMLDDVGLKLAAEADLETSTQVLLAAAVRHSLLLGDFLRDVYAADVRRMERTLNHHQWESFLCECAHRDPSVSGWTQSTRRKLFQVILRILAEAKFLDSTRSRALTPPMLHPQVRLYLTQLGDLITLSRMEPQA